MATDHHTKLEVAPQSETITEPLIQPATTTETSNNIDPECEKLLKNTKRQVKQIMEEAVTRKFVHEESSSIISLSVAVDACLSHGLKRRALGLFKTSSSTALIQKIAKQCKSAEEVRELLFREEQRIQENQKNQSKSNSNSRTSTQENDHSKKKVASTSTTVKQRHMWIRLGLIEKKLVSIVEYLADNSCLYYESNALMSNYLCAQILCSLLVGPTAIEFSRSKTHNHCFDEPSADELLKRHKLAIPVACLCQTKERRLGSTTSAINVPTKTATQHLQLSRSATDTTTNLTRAQRPGLCSRLSLSHNFATSAYLTEPLNSNQSNGSGFHDVAGQSDRRRRPLALKATARRGTLVTDCHHYSCQEFSEHQQTRGYSFLNSGSSCQPFVSQTPPANSNLTNNVPPKDNPSAVSNNQSTVGPSDWPPWSPRVLHETLYQNTKSSLLYAKNNVLLETQPGESMAGYLSLHQTSSDLILKWIPNQMINGVKIGECCSSSDSTCGVVKPKENHDGDSTTRPASAEPDLHPDDATTDKQVVVHSSCLDLVVNLTVSKIVLLHCSFGAPKYSNNETCLESNINGKVQPGGDILILVEADGVQRAPFRFPKGGLKLFLSCLESGLAPDKYLDPAIHFGGPEESVSLIGSSSEHIDREPISSKISLILKRLPSLKRKLPINGDQLSQRSNPSPESSETPTVELEDEVQTNSTSNDSIKTSTYVYRIVSVQQPDWLLHTPPGSALSVDSSSSGSFILTSSFSLQKSSPSNQTTNGGHKFPWSLSKLARFSQSGSVSSPARADSATGIKSICQTTGSTDLSNISEPYNSVDSASDNYMKSKRLAPGSAGGSSESTAVASVDPSVARSRDLARIEAKLVDLKVSTSDHLLALRTHSVQTLCDSMRKQIVARAFYGWLVHCRKSKIIRAHLMKLVKLQAPGNDSNSTKAKTTSSLINSSKLFYEQSNEFENGLTRVKWQQFMEKKNELNEFELSSLISLHVYYGNIENDSLRKEVWPYLLGHYDFKDGVKERKLKDRLARKLFKQCSSQWIKVERVVKQRDRELLAANIAKAVSERHLKDTLMLSNNQDEAQTQVNKEHKTSCSENTQSNSNVKKAITDNSECQDHKQQSTTSIDKEESFNDEKSDGFKQALIETVDKENEVFKTPPDPHDSHLPTRNIEDDGSTCTPLVPNATAPKIRRKNRPRLDSTGSVGSDASITEQFGNNVHRIDKDVQRCDRNYWYFKNSSNLEKLRNIMCTYVWQHLDVGYVQGMCDLAAPFLVVFDDEVLAFSCFSQLMKRMVYNFPHGCAMDQHFDSLKHLMQVLDPRLYEILQSGGDYTHFYFCYRWLLLDFKREFTYEDVFQVWEAIWSARHVATDHFVIFLALAMVRYYRDIIIDNNMDFTDTIKFFNEMAERHDVGKIIELARESVVELEQLINL